MPEREDILAELEKSIERGDRKAARSLLRRFIESERALGRFALGAGEKIRELGEEIEEGKKEEESVFAPLMKKKKPERPVETYTPAVAKIDNIIRQLEQLKTVV